MTEPRVEPGHEAVAERVAAWSTANADDGASLEVPHRAAYVGQCESDIVCGHAIPKSAQREEDRADAGGTGLARRCVGAEMGMAAWVARTHRDVGEESALDGVLSVQATRSAWQG